MPPETLSTTNDTRFARADDRYHHHSALEGVETFLMYVDAGWPIPALCGRTRSPVGNPLRLPCCPRCAELLTEPCGRTW